MPLRYDPGERWMYSYSTDVCGYLVEAISGKPFDEYLQETIFDPLGMKDTSFFVAPEKAPRLAANYRRAPRQVPALIDDPEKSPYLAKPTFLSGGGGLTGTTADYLRFCEMLRRGGELDGARVLGPRTIELMTQNHLAGGKDLTADGDRRVLRDGVRRRRLRPRLRDDARARSRPARWARATTTGAAPPRRSSGSTRRGPGRDLHDAAHAVGTFNFRGQLKSIVYSAIVD